MEVISTEFGSPIWALWTIPLSALAMVAGTVMYARIVGLRSFSKMTNFDFAITVATGSVIGSVILSTGTAYSVGNGMLAVGSLFLVQALIAYLRTRSSAFTGVVDNDPLLLMGPGGELLEENLRASRVRASDVYAKLREANVLQLSEVHCVVLETTGDISVLHGSDGSVAVDDAILDGVRQHA